MTTPVRFPLVLICLFLPTVGHTQPAAPDSGIGTSTAPPLTYTVSFLTRYELRDEFDTIGASRGRFIEGDGVAYRARLGIDLPAVDIGGNRTVGGRFTPQASGFLGEGSVVDSPLGVHEGFLHIAGPNMTVDAGRFVMNYGDAVVIGDLEWHQTARSFQGLRGTYKPGPEARYQIDAFVTQLAEGRTAGTLEPTGAGDQYFYGVYAMLGSMFSKPMALDVYALGLTWPKTHGVPVDPADATAGTGTRAAATTITAGGRVKNHVGILDYRMEVGVQVGSAPGLPNGDDPSVRAYHGDLEIGLYAGALRIAAEGLYASGDDPETIDRVEGWNHLFPTAHKFLGLADIMGARNNIAGGVAHLSYALGGGTTAKLDGHVFARVQPAVVAGPTGYTGTEIDAQLIKVLGNGLKVRALYSLFLPDEDIVGVDSAAHYLEIELRYDLN